MTLTADFHPDMKLYSWGYDAPSHTLEVELKTGRVYQHYDVPLSIFQEMTKTRLKSQFWHENIKHDFQFSRIG